MKILKEFYSCNRYIFDFDICKSSDGWSQMDNSQDAHYFGAWINVKELKFIEYCEGDITKIDYDNEIEFVIELLKYKEDENFIGIDTLCNEDITQRFIKLGLESLLH